MRWIVSGLVFSLAACGGGKAPLGAGQGGSDSGTDSGLDAGGVPDADTDAGMDAGHAVDAGWDAGDSGDAGVDAGDGQGFCDYTITEEWESLNFGQVTPDAFEDGGVLPLLTVTDRGSMDCLVSFTLTPDTDPAFTLVGGPIVSQRLGPGFASGLQVDVSFDPRGPGGYRGALTSDITDPSNPSDRLPFSITLVGGNSCVLLKPSLLDFGPVTRGPCPGAHQSSFTLINGCAQEVTIESATFADGGPFALVGGQVPQTVAQGGTSSPFTVELPGAEDGIYSGTLFVQTDLRSEPLTVTLVGAVAPGTAQTDNFIFEGNYLFLLSDTPDRDGPTLTVNGTALSEGLDWSYDPLTNILAIDSTWLTLNLGDQIEISYHLACS